MYTHAHNQPLEVHDCQITMAGTRVGTTRSPGPLLGLVRDGGPDNQGNGMGVRLATHTQKKREQRQNGKRGIPSPVIPDPITPSDLGEA